MRTISKQAAFLALAMLAGGYATPAAAQATRTWVSGVGDDANPCSRTAPCKTFAGAISKTATAGERSALRIMAVDGHRLGDRHGAVAARIQAVDLAARGGLRDRAGEGLARRRAAARIDVVADAGHPGAGGLSLGRGGAEHRRAEQRKRCEQK